MEEKKKEKKVINVKDVIEKNRSKVPALSTPPALRAPNLSTEEEDIEAIANAMDDECSKDEIKEELIEEEKTIIKPGWKKSEFWASLLFEAYTFILITPNITIEWWLRYPLTIIAVVLLLHWVYFRIKLYNGDYKKTVVSEFAKKLVEVGDISEALNSVIADTKETSFIKKFILKLISKIISKIKSIKSIKSILSKKLKFFKKKE